MVHVNTDFKFIRSKVRSMVYLVMLLIPCNSSCFIRQISTKFGMCVPLRIRKVLYVNSIFILRFKSQRWLFP